MALPWLVCAGLLACGDDTDKPVTRDAGRDGGRCTLANLNCTGGGKTPRCCAGGCGSSTESWLPAQCTAGKWQCMKGTLEYRCASPDRACLNQDYCGGQVGIGGEEPDPAPELCCEWSCNGKRAMHRKCEDGLWYNCPAGTIPISLCANLAAACGGIFCRYRDNGYKLP
jgi:hypothetical protein